MKRLFLISTVLASLFLYHKVSAADVTVTIPDTTVSRGTKLLMPVRASFAIPHTGPMRAKLSFNSVMLFVTETIGADTLAAHCPNCVSNQKLSNSDTAVLEVSCKDFDSESNSIMFYIGIQALAGPDTIAYIHLDSLFVGGLALNVDSKASIIKFTDDPVFQKSPERIGQNYPNPFVYSTCFPISIRATNSVIFNIYNLNGDRVLSNERDPNMFKLTKSSNPASDPIDPTEKLERGNYYLFLTPDSWKLGAGMHYIQMITDNSVSNTNFIYIK